MAFNLNKTDQSSPKFNLTKQEEHTVEKEKSGSGKTPLIVIAILIIAGSAWYLLREKPSASRVTTVTVATQDSAGLNSEAGTATVNSTLVAGTDHSGDVSTAVKEETDVLQNSITANFDPGSISLQPDEDMVRRLTDVLTKDPGKKIVVYGYASSEGDLPTNMRLSEQRAQAFKTLLVNKGVSGARISTLAKGIDDPLADNNTPEGRKKNRRVQVTIIE